MLFPFLISCFRGNNWLENQFESNSHSLPSRPPLPRSVSQSMVGVVISQVLPALSFLNCLDILDWDGPIRKQFEIVLTNDRAGNSLGGSVLWMPPVLGEGRILSNTSSQRPLGSQGWGWEKFPLGGVFTKPGVMSHVSCLLSRLFLRVNKSIIRVSWE